MDPNSIESLINAAIDRELPPADKASLADRLASDASGQSLADQVRRHDALLRQAFQPRRDAATRLAERVMQLIEVPKQSAELSQTPETSETSSQPHTKTGWKSWLPLLLAVAAGFLLAVVLFRPWLKDDHLAKKPAETNDKPNVAPTEIVKPSIVPVAMAHLALATGPVEIRPRGNLANFRCPTRGPIDTGMDVCTGDDVRCELSTPDGSAVRMNADTTLRFDQPRSISMERGQLWSCVAKSTEPMSVKASSATIQSDEGTIDVTCQGSEATLKVLGGTARISNKDGERIVPAGREVTIRDGTISEETSLGDSLLSTRWINDVLKLKGPENAELQDRIEQMLANIGNTKLTFLYEREIRALGEASVPPLTHFLRRSSPEVAPDKRQEAARILGDLATSRLIPDLIFLLGDQDGNVRFHAAGALARLTGETQNMRSEDWKTGSPESLDAARNAWKKWWQANKAGFGAAGEAATSHE